MNLNLSTIGGRIRAAREALGWTQDRLRSVAHLSKGFLSDLEHDKRNPSANTLCELSDALKVSVEWLVRGKHGKPMRCPLCGVGKLQF